MSFTNCCLFFFFRTHRRVGVNSGIYTAATLEYLTREVLDLSGAVAHGDERNQIKVADLRTVFTCDNELSKLTEKSIFPREEK